MENTNYLIIISINFGENFPLNEVVRHFNQQTQTFVTIEARFNDTVLTCDPIEITSPSVDLKTELCFQVDKKQLHSFRIERKPIKLQTYITDSSSDDRHHVGYVVLDLRNAKNYSTHPKYEWLNLLNPKYKGLSSKRPQMSIALMLHKLEGNETGDTAGEESLKPVTDDTDPPEHDSSAAEHKSYLECDSLNQSIDESNVDNDINVRFKDGFHHIWDAKEYSESDCKQKYVFSVTIAFAEHLRKLFVSTEQIQNSKPFHFRYSILGTTVKTKSFSDIDSCDFQIERTAFDILTTDKNTLNVYFDLHQTIEIQFCDNLDIMFGLVTISLAKFADKSQTSFKPIEGSYMLLPDNETLDVGEPFPIIGVSVELRRDGVLQTEMAGKESKSNRLGSPSKSSIKEQVQRSPDKRGTNESDLNHYCFAIDLRNIRVIDEEMPPITSCYLQFLYAFFGFTENIKTFPSIELKLNEPIVIPHGFCAFNFATTHAKLEKTFREIPLVIEVIEESKINTIIGTAKVDLSVILSVKPNKADAKQVTNVIIPVIDEMDKKFAEIQIIMFLQNYGKTEIPVTSSDPEVSVMTKDVVRDGRVESNVSVPNVDDLLIETALEIELWKEKQLILFNEKMKQKEVECEKRFENKQIEREEHFKAKLKEVSELENRLLESIDELKEREKELTLRESEVEAKHKAINERYEKLNEEINAVINDLKVKYEEKMESERERTKGMESEKCKYQEKVYSLERKLKEKDIGIKELEEKVQELTNKLNAKTGVKTPSKSTSVKSTSGRAVNGTTAKVPTVIREPLVSSRPNGTKPLVKSQMIFSKTTSPALKTNVKPVNNSTRITSNRVTTKLNNNRSDEKSTLIAKIKQNRQQLIDSGVSLNDPIIKEIDSKLKGV